MHGIKLCILILVSLVHLSNATANSWDSIKNCRKAFVYKTDEFAVANMIQICSDASHIPFGYEADINMPVCDDKLCANVILKFYWDLAGNYTGFDTIPGKPLTKFDHKKFLSADYQRLDQILKDRNSMLRILEKEDLIDKSIKVKATTVDAVTGATPATVKNAVVEGAVYSSFTLWHFVNGPLKNRLVSFTQSIYSDSISAVLLNSTNFETQFFALKQMNENDFVRQADLLFRIIPQSTPIIKAYIIGKLPLPFADKEKNLALISLFPKLDSYAKSIFLNRIISEKRIAETFLPILMQQKNDLDKKQIEILKTVSEKFHIEGYNENE